MISCSVRIVNPLGLHARAAAKFVHVASAFASAIRVGRSGREIDGKSIMGLLLLSASQGTAVTISVDGTDERQALTALCALVERGFDETPFDSPGAAGLAQGTPAFDSPDAAGLAQGRPVTLPGDDGQDEP